MGNTTNEVVPLDNQHSLQPEKGSSMNDAAGKGNKSR